MRFALRLRLASRVTRLLLPVLREFPVVLQQSVEAGKTPAGTKVQGKLAAATLFNGTLIPKNAVASGVVVESESKRGEDRARLAIRMNTVSWNGGWAPLNAYLMPLYYPATGQAVPNLPIRISGSGLQDLEWTQPGVGVPDVPTISERRPRSQSRSHPGRCHPLESASPNEKCGT